VKPTDELAQLRAATRQLHEVIQEAKQVRKDIQDRVDSIGPALDRVISECVAESLNKYADTVLAAIEDATAMVYRRFETLADALLGEDRKSRKDGDATLQEVLMDVPMSAQTRHRLERWRATGLVADEDA